MTDDRAAVLSEAEAVRRRALAKMARQKRLFGVVLRGTAHDPAGSLAAVRRLTLRQLRAYIERNRAFINERGHFARLQNGEIITPRERSRFEYARKRADDLAQARFRRLADERPDGSTTVARFRAIRGEPTPGALTVVRPVFGRTRRAEQSASRLGFEKAAANLTRLADDMESGRFDAERAENARRLAWDATYGHLPVSDASLSELMDFSDFMDRLKQMYETRSGSKHENARIFNAAKAAVDRLMAWGRAYDERQGRQAPSEEDIRRRF